MQGLGRDEEARSVIREGLDDDPSAASLLVMLGDALPAGDKWELGERFARLPEPAEQFEGVCEEFWGDANALESLVTAYRPLAPEDPNLAYYQAQVHLLREEPGSAVAILEPVLPKVKKREDFEHFEELYFQAVVVYGRWREAYSTATDKTRAFTLIAEYLWYEEDPGPMKELVALHRQQAPDDPQLHGYVGQLAEREGDWPRAIAAYRKAVDHAPDGGWRSWLVAAMFYGERAMEALRTVEPTDRVFRQLMRLADVQDPPAIDLMENLLHEFHSLYPEGAASTFWESRLAYLRQDYARAVELLRQHAEEIKKDDDLSWGFGPLLVDCLVRLEMYDEAQREALRIYQEDGDPFRAAVVAAAQGDIEQTAKWLQRCVDEFNYSSRLFYNDELLGPALRSEAFKTLREQYPPPAIEPATVDVEAKPATND